MSERPILFTAPMVRAILAGTKNLTRRIVKLPGEKGLEFHGDIDVWTGTGGGVWEAGECHQGPIASLCLVRCPYGQPGDRLWVRETWKVLNRTDPVVIYAADGADRVFRMGEGGYNFKPKDEDLWRPSLFMPRWASRITLEVVSVRVERLQEITLADIEAEGVGGLLVPGTPSTTRPEQHFAATWDTIYGKPKYVYSVDEATGKRKRRQVHPGWPWASNPWVWRIEFRRRL